MFSLWIAQPASLSLLQFVAAAARRRSMRIGFVLLAALRQVMESKAQGGVGVAEV